MIGEYDLNKQLSNSKIHDSTVSKLSIFNAEMTVGSMTKVKEADYTERHGEGASNILSVAVGRPSVHFVPVQMRSQCSQYIL